MDINSYKMTITELMQNLTKMEIYADNLGMENSKASLHALNERIKSDRFNLAVLGEFRRGKSTLINALLRTSVLPVDLVPCTSTVNRITYDMDARARVEFMNGSTKEIPIGDLREYVTQDGEKSDNVREVTVWYPTVYCANNVDLYDTPGLNDSPGMTRATTDVISRMDVAIFTLSADTNFSKSEVHFLGEKLLTSDVGRVIFAVTRMGDKTPEQRERILENIRDRINKLVLGKAEQVFAENPGELENFKRKLGKIQIYGVDSVMALKARETYNAAMLEESGFPAFEHAIDEMLTRERGRVMLEKQTGAILRASNDIFNLIQARMLPLTVSEEEFDARCEEAEKKIASVNELTKTEKERLEQAAEFLIQDTRATWKKLVKELENKVHETAMGLDIDKNTLLNVKARKAYAETAVRDLIMPQLARELQIYSERLQNTVNDSIGKECMNLSAFEEKVADNIEEINKLFELKTTKVKAGQVIHEIALNATSLSGGVKTGYRIAGKKGAVVGGVSGLAVTAGAAYAIGAVLGIAGIAVSTPIAIGGAVVAGVLGFFGADKIVKDVLWKDLAVPYRQQISDTVCQMFDKVLEENAFDNLLCDNITESFRAIEREIEANTTGMLSDLQMNLQKMQVSYAAEKAQTEQQLQNYMGILESLAAISERASSVREAYGID